MEKYNILIIKKDTSYFFLNDFIFKNVSEIVGLLKNYKKFKILSNNNTVQSSTSCY